MVRIEGFRLVNEQAMSIVKKWRKIKHANIVSIREAFTTRAFGDSCKLGEPILLDTHTY